MKKFGVIAIIILCSCASRIPDYSQGRPYTVLDTYTDPQPTDRVIREYIIQSDAASFEERCQTAIKAAYELSRKDHNDLTVLNMVPAAELMRSPIAYAHVLYARDGKGATGLGGADPSLDNAWVWQVSGSDRILTKKELSILQLFFSHMKDFPSANLLSSSSFDEEKLKEFVAETLKVKPGEVVIPVLTMKEYPVR